MSKRDVIRCLKRYVAREVYSAIQKPAQILDGFRLLAEYVA